MMYLACFLCLLFSNGLLASDVLEFTDSTFDERIKQHDLILVEFYAPWCGHCKRLAPEYEKAATLLKNADTPVPLAKVDCDANKVLCETQNVRGFPTLKIFRKGSYVSDYDGPREANGIYKHMGGMVGPSSKELKTVDDFKKFIDSKEFTIVGFFEKESKLKDSFLKVADLERTKFRFGHTSEKEILKEHGVNDDIIVFVPKKYHNKFEDSKVVYEGNFDSDRIKKFLNSEIYGLCGHRQVDNAASFSKPLLIAYYDVDYERNPKGTNYFRNRMMKVAKEFKRKLTFCISNKDEFAGEIESFGLSDDVDKQNMIVAVLDKDKRKYVMKDEFSVENLKTFVENFLAGKLEPSIKSEPIPETNDSPVKVVVAKTFDDFMKQDKDIMLEFYAPWCGHCKNLAPVYDQLGIKMENENVLIAKIDATANDIPDNFEVHGFPTLYWVPRNAKDKPQSYTGGRTLEDFIKYIARHATDELKGWDRNGKPRKEEL
ncbi:Protein disulfide-isomerase A3 [Trichinella pseudospiralis]|uniref:Protein disulfide-isomerase n=1 Tax=Trichinella pseudospiralis TaxID=6337 RepID=A0A0V1HXA2_TRIPS|nr:Protein disulfide-isomerase A3 [Trichinella pseudospiralis]KRZ45345.1 Protein disulfide-isomerase A3 [Trichinella pseudospiralis]